MRFEYKRGSLHASHARRALLHAVRAYLPEEAFAQLDSMPMQRELVEAWADSHGINAPCVVEEFANYCAGGWSQHVHWGTSSWTGPKIPFEWLQQVDEWNKRPIDPWAWRGSHADERLLDEAGRGKIVLGVGPDVVKEALDGHLGPISTDPSQESWEDFHVRARHHWLARAVEAKAFGFRPAGTESEWRNLDRDIGWLLRHQVNQETYETIAGPPNGESPIEPDMVKKAIDRLSRAIGLKRKRGRRAARRRS